MNVYFTCTTREFDEHKESYFKIRETILKLGHIITRDWLGADEIDLSPKDVYKLVAQAVKAASVVVAELSVPSMGIASLISEALQNKKPVLVLVHEDKKESLHNYLQAAPSNLISLRTYKNFDDIEPILKSFFLNAEDSLERKFNFLITPEIDNYLEWCAKQRNKTKSVVARDAIERVMRDDEEYQDRG